MLACSTSYGLILFIIMCVGTAITDYMLILINSALSSYGFFLGTCEPSFLTPT